MFRPLPSRQRRLSRRLHPLLRSHLSSTSFSTLPTSKAPQLDRMRILRRLGLGCGRLPDRLLEDLEG